MHRRSFLGCLLCGGSACFSPPSQKRTQHLVVIGSTGGLRKRDYFENASLAPNIQGLAREGFVFAEDHSERVGSHARACSELLQGRSIHSDTRSYPSLLDYLGGGVQVHSIDDIPLILQQFRPRVILCTDDGHDVGHESYEQYLGAVAATDAAIGRVFHWVKSHPYFSSKTAIVFRPVFGRDDEVNEHGQLHHSYGFYYTHRVAGIFWGPDFNRGVDRKTIVNAVDLTPTLTTLFGVNATHAEGRVLPGLFRALV
jgi:arylsulfatase A-like enzyme